MIENYSRVRLLTDKYSHQGADIGDIGYVIEVYDNDGYEVEFSAADGTTYAQITAHVGELVVTEPAPVSVGAAR